MRRRRGARPRREHHRRGRRGNRRDDRAGRRRARARRGLGRSLGRGVRRSRRRVGRCGARIERRLGRGFGERGRGRRERRRGRGERRGGRAERRRRDPGGPHRCRLSRAGLRLVRHRALSAAGIRERRELHRGSTPERARGVGRDHALVRQRAGRARGGDSLRRSLRRRQGRDRGGARERLRRRPLQARLAEGEGPGRTVSARSGTYSIVARDAGSGELGVAVGSHWFSVGSIVPWARAGVGAVAIQSIAEPAYGERLLARLAAGEGPAEALAAELDADELARFRQVACVDAGGRVAAHTGAGCMPDAGHRVGDGFCAQANLMSSPDVWPAIAGAFERSAGPFARRLTAALAAGEAAGGDVRGRQSAALLVVPADGEPWRRSVELRVEDHPDPLAELNRLLDLADAYALADRADTLAGQGRHHDAAALYREAADAAPGNLELLFWSGLGIAAGGDLAAGASRVRESITAHDGWGRLLARLDPEIAPAVESVRAALGVSRAAPGDEG
ncbi:MAG: DUF1028 domain-containing protein [Solirubrobacterales bacterium]|nr:DUF1028 domain-containing protein [Solirubrobacterales bacterium]